jgi:L-ascorbate metabolism protein UlaG (beta-lactamase superfamily)
MLASCTPEQPPLKVTYIGNTGFHIASGSASILIDALHCKGRDVYVKPSEGMLDSMINGISPFQTVDYLFITHRHPDHFNDSLTYRFLAAHPETMVVCPAQVTSILQGDSLSFARHAANIISVALDTGRTQRFSRKDLAFSATRTKHADSYDIENLLYVIEANQNKLMHSGDSYDGQIAHLQDIDLKTEQIDLAILTAGYGRKGFAIAKEQIAPKEIIFCHFYKHLSGKLQSAMKKDTATFRNITAFFQPGETRMYDFTEE